MYVCARTSFHNAARFARSLSMGKGQHPCMCFRHATKRTGREERDVFTAERENIYLVVSLRLKLRSGTCSFVNVVAANNINKKLEVSRSRSIISTHGSAGSNQLGLWDRMCLMCSTTASGQRQGEGILAVKPHRTSPPPPDPLISNQIGPSAQLHPITGNYEQL